MRFPMKSQILPLSSGLSFAWSSPLVLYRLVRNQVGIIVYSARNSAILALLRPASQILLSLQLRCLPRVLSTRAYSVAGITRVNLKRRDLLRCGQRERRTGGIRSATLGDSATCC